MAAMHMHVFAAMSALVLCDDAVLFLMEDCIFKVALMNIS